MTTRKAAKIEDSIVNELEASEAYEKPVIRKVLLKGFAATAIPATDNTGGYSGTDSGSGSGSGSGTGPSLTFTDIPAVD